ncbi:MAG: hypothetical protein LBT07_01980 [Endomicrobium sp.]|nr:hypothetical protein [Endomicrobium sp.]
MIFLLTMHNLAYGRRAVFIEGISKDYNEETLTFNGYTDSWGGVIFLEKMGTIKIDCSTITFKDNRATESGGAMIITRESNLIVSGSTVNFTSNTARDKGGAIKIFDKAGLTFSGSTVGFKNNMGCYGGGAFLLASSIAFNNSVVDFAGNEAKIDGGAISIENCSTITLKSAGFIFRGNVADFGGAIYNDHRTLNLNSYGGNIEFVNNTARIEQGHDIYSKSGVMNISGIGDVIIGGGIA